MIRRKLLALLLILAMVLGLSACGSSSKKEGEGGEGELINGHKPITLRIYAQYADEDTKLPYDYAVEELKKEMPWVTLELDVQAQDDGQKLKTYAATGDMPDIFNCGLDLINTFVKSKNIATLNEYVEGTGYDKDILDNCKDLLYHPDGNVYAFPYAGNEFVTMYYNTELFEQQGLKVPETFDELLNAVYTLSEAGITPISIFAQEGWVTTAMYDMIATKYIPLGIKGLDTGTNKITEEGYLKAAQKLSELVTAKAFAKGATGLNYDQATSLFYKGEAAMFVNGQWFITDADKNMKGKADWFYFPTTSDGGSNKYAMSGSGSVGGFAVSPTAKDELVAAKVAAFMAKKIAEYKYTQRANTVVAVKVEKPFECEVSPMIEKLAKEMPNFTSNSAFSWGLSNAKFKTTLEEQTQALIAGTVDPEEFINLLGKSLE